MTRRIRKSLFFILFICAFFKCSLLDASAADTSSAFFNPSDPIRVAYNKDIKTKLVNVGRAPFAIASPKFDCSGFTSSVKPLKYLHIAWLYNTFGSDYRCLNKILDDSRLITLQTNLINEPGHRNKRLEKHEFLYDIKNPQEYDRLLKANDAKLHRKFKKYVRPLQDLLMSRLQPQTECLINPGLESNVSAAAGKVLVKWAKAEFPFCKIVWNPIAKATDTQGTGASLVEQHGWFPKFATRSCTFNNDGSDINFPERKSPAVFDYEKNPNNPKNFLNAGNPLQSALEEYANQCKVVYVWTVEDNCFAYDAQTAPWAPPSQRSCKNGPVNGLVAKEIQRTHLRGVRAPKIFKWTEDESASLKGCSSVSRPNDGDKRGFLLKQSEFPDRGGVILLPGALSGATEVSIVHKGRVVDAYARGGRYTHDGSQRDLWRSNKTPISYPLKVVIKIRKNSQVACYKVNNPRIRND